MASNKGPARGVSWLTEPTGAEEVFTPERLSEEQRMFGQTAFEFAAKEVGPRLAELEEKKGEVAMALLSKAGELGILAVDVPEEYEGLGLDKVTTTVVAEKLAEGGACSFMVTHGAHTGIGTLPIVFFGTEEQKKKYLPDLATGRVAGCYCLTEAGSGSDALAAKTKAVLSEDGTHYVLNGEKMWITNAGFASTAIVFAKIDGKDFTGFIVETAWPGVSTGHEEKKMGIHGSSTRTLILEDVRVPVENVLYMPGRGHVIAFNILNIGRFKLGAGCLGGVKIAMRDSVLYANQRQQFKVPIATFRALREKMANMFVKAYVLESMAYRAAGSMDEAIALIDKSAEDATEKVVAAIEEFAVEASIMKVWGSEALDYAVDEGVQIHGGYGYSQEYAIERAYRDSRINRLFEGTNEINRLLIPGTILKRSMKGQVPLMPFAMKLEKELGEGGPAADDEGPLAAETHLSERVKRAVVLTCGRAIKRYMMELSKPERQMVLMAMADMIMEVYGLDTAVARTRQYVAERGADKARIPVLLTRIYAAETADFVRTTACRLLGNCLEGEELRKAVAAVETLLPFVATPTYELKDQVAAHLIEREAYNLE